MLVGLKSLWYNDEKSYIFLNKGGLMDQINQTNNLQQAIDEVANKEQFGVPPMPPMEGEGVPAPFGSETKEPSAEQILSDSLNTAEMPKVESSAEPAADAAMPSEMPAAVPEAPAVNTSETSAPAVNAAEVSGDLASIRENVIKDLLPLMDKVDSTPEEKFEIYKDAMKTMHDAKTIEGAYRTATQIGDESKKADALLGLMKTIDNA